jgi:polysaccharide biosynthesis protein PslF
MRLCIISSTFPPQAAGKRCGIGDYTAHLAQHLAPHNFEIDVLTSASYVGPEQPAPSTRVLPHIDRWQITTLKKVRGLWRHNAYDWISWQYQPAIYGGKWSFYNSMLAWLAQRSSRLITTFHTLTYPSPLSPTRLNAFAISALSHQIVVTNEKHRQELLRLYPKAKSKHHLIPVGSNILPDHEKWQNRDAIYTQIRQKLGIAPRQLLISNFGLIYPDKNLEALVHAVGQLHTSGHSVHLLLIGQVRPSSQPYLAKIKNLVQQAGLENDVTWVHDCPVDEVSDYLFASDIYAVPYKDGLTTRRGSALAGMAHGLPTVSTKGPATPDIFVGGENILLTPLEDETAFFQALLDLVTSSEKRHRLGNAARGLSVQFSWEFIARQFAQVLMEAKDS